MHTVCLLSARTTCFMPVSSAANYPYRVVLGPESCSSKAHFKGVRVDICDTMGVSLLHMHQH